MVWAEKVPVVAAVPQDPQPRAFVIVRLMISRILQAWGEWVIGTDDDQIVQTLP
jgi:hypothetical protein